MSNDSDWVNIQRTFDAAIDDVWSKWTDAAQFGSWYGPRGMTVIVETWDLKVGGIRKVCMQMQRPDRKMQMWFTGVFKEISAPRRLVYTEAMCDESGTLIPPAAMGLPPETPDITEVIVDLAENGGRTEMTMVHRGVPAGTAGEGGWLQAFDKLATQLA